MQFFKGGSMKTKLLFAAMVMAGARIASAQIDDATKSTLQPMLDNAHQSADPVLASPLIDKADKDKLRVVLKDFDTFAETLLHSTSPTDPSSAFKQIMDHANAVTNYISDHPAMNLVSSRAQQITMYETIMLQGLAMGGMNANQYAIMLKAAAIDEGTTQKVSALTDKLIAEEKHLTALMMDNNQSPQARQDAANSMNPVAAKTRTDIRALLTPDQSADLDWQFLLYAHAGTPNDGIPVACIGLLAPIKAPQDGSYVLKAGPRDGPYQTLSTVTLKKGDPIGFDAAKTTAGKNEVALNNNPAPAIFWEIQPPLKSPIEVTAGDFPLNPN